MSCGCGKRAVRLVRLLGVEMDREYVERHHFRATIKAIAMRLFGRKHA
jgi:hypothetical protein